MRTVCVTAKSQPLGTIDVAEGALEVTQRSVPGLSGHLYHEAIREPQAGAPFAPTEAAALQAGGYPAGVKTSSHRNTPPNANATCALDQPSNRRSGDITA